jgi:hypothetical protein
MSNGQGRTDRIACALAITYLWIVRHVINCPCGKDMGFTTVHCTVVKDRSTFEERKSDHGEQIGGMFLRATRPAAHRWAPINVPIVYTLDLSLAAVTTALCAPYTTSPQRKCLFVYWPLDSAIRPLLLLELMHQRPLAFISGGRQIENRSNNRSVLTILQGRE